MKPSTIPPPSHGDGTSRYCAGVGRCSAEAIVKGSHKKTSQHWIPRVLEAMLIIFASQLQSAIGSCQMFSVFFRSFWWEKPWSRSLIWICTCMANWWVLRLACLYSDHLRTRAIYASGPNRLPLSTMFQSNDLFCSWVAWTSWTSNKGLSDWGWWWRGPTSVHLAAILSMLSTLHQPAGVQGKVIPSQPPWVPMGFWPQQSPDNSTYMSPQSLANAWQPKERMEVWWDLAMTKRYQKVHVFGGNYIPWFALILRYSRPPILHHLWPLFLGKISSQIVEKQMTRNDL